MTRHAAAPTPTLTRAGLLAAGAGTIACGVLLAAVPDDAGSAPSARLDASILTFVLLLEDIQSAFYAEGLRRARLAGELRTFAQVVGGQEREHAALVRRLLGRAAGAPPQLDFGDDTADAERFAASALRLEDLGVKASFTQAAHLTPGALAQPVLRPGRLRHERALGDADRLAGRRLHRHPRDRPAGAPARPGLPRLHPHAQRRRPGAGPAHGAGHAADHLVGLVLVRHEVALARAAHGTEPRVRDVLEGGPGRDAAVGVAVGGVVDEPAGLADPLLHGRALAHVGRNGTGRAASSVFPVDVDRPGPGEELNAGGAVTVPRQAATVIVLRGGAATLEVLLVQRNPAQRFMGGAWVFPGGAVDAGEGEGDAAHRAAAVRELAEEAAVEGVDPTSLVRFSQWITPPQVKIRFDTHFFLAALPDGAEPAVDGEECVDLGWFTPAGALHAFREGELLLVFPTIKHLEQLGAFASADALLEHARGRDVVAVVPRVLMSGEQARILLPGEPGYDEAPEGPATA